MKKVLLLCTILTLSVMTSACINNLAVKELNTKAESYLDKGDTDAAICRLKSSLDLDSDIYQTHYNLAVAYNAIGNYDGAIAEANKVLELKQEVFDAYYIIAVAQEAQAYKLIQDQQNSSFSPEIISEFENKAQDAIDTYNKYLENVPNAVETDKINAKIVELNSKIKEFANNLNTKQKNDNQLSQKNDIENPLVEEDLI